MSRSMIGQQKNALVVVAKVCDSTFRMTRISLTFVSFHQLNDYGGRTHLYGLIVMFQKDIIQRRYLQVMKA